MSHNKTQSKAQQTVGRGDAVFFVWASLRNCRQSRRWHGHRGDASSAAEHQADARCVSAQEAGGDDRGSRHWRRVVRPKTGGRSAARCPAGRSEPSLGWLTTGEIALVESGSAFSLGGDRRTAQPVAAGASTAPFSASSSGPGALRLAARRRLWRSSG